LKLESENKPSIELTAVSADINSMSRPSMSFIFFFARAFLNVLKRIGVGAGATIL